jgi:prevent-host-death family protein
MYSQWTLQDAKNKFSAVVNAACSGTPQIVTKRGSPAVVIISAESYERLKHGAAVPLSFKELLLSIPKDDENEEFSSSALQLREVDF